MSRAANAMAELIVRACDPEEVLLFGSFAKGEQRAHSDIDLLVITATRASGALHHELRDLLVRFRSLSTCTCSHRMLPAPRGLTAAVSYSRSCRRRCRFTYAVIGRSCWNYAMTIDTVGMKSYVEGSEELKVIVLEC